MRAQFWREHGRANVFEQTPLSDNVADVRNVVQGDGFRRQDRGRHAGQRRILCATDRDTAFDRVTTPNAKLVHAERLKERE